MTTAHCPSCGGPLEFKIGSSFLIVCPYCRSAIARTDRALSDLGKVAALADTDSPLAIGLAGKYNGKSFRLTGRAQLRHALGGVWDEWYAAFDDNRWGWLAEAQGRFYMSFESPIVDLPDFEDLAIGQTVPKLRIPMVVSEKGSATYSSADGEIPFALVPNSTVKYADLSGAENLFATLDYSGETPVFYAGNEVTLGQLALQSGGAQLKREKTVAVTNLACPNCGGPLELRAPDATERVGCPHCGSLLDCSQGKLSLLQALNQNRERPLLKLGSEAEFEGVKLIVIGFMMRSCLVQGVKYFWNEYLLYNASLGFRWLVHSDSHWTYVKAVNNALVRVSSKYAYFKGKSFKRFQDAPATVECVLGEFYWKVTVGEKVQTSDFVCPPEMLSSERATYDGNKQGHASDGEIAWSIGEYVPVDEIKTKFKLPALAVPRTVGACQPNPHQGWFFTWLKVIAALIALTVLLLILRPDNSIVDEEIQFAGQTPAKPAAKPVEPAPADSDVAPQPPPVAEPAADVSPVWLSQPFQLKANQKVHIEARTTVDNSWVALEGALIDDAKGEAVPFELNIEYYHGVDEDGNWSEGSQSNSEYLPSQPPGTYIIRVEGHWEKMDQPIHFHLVAEQTAIDPAFLMLALLAVSILPAIMIYLKFAFESNRWKESMYGSSSSGD